jgi:hypothetical protein
VVTGKNRVREQLGVMISSAEEIFLLKESSAAATALHDACIIVLGPTGCWTSVVKMPGTGPCSFLRLMRPSSSFIRTNFRFELALVSILFFQKKKTYLLVCLNHRTQYSIHI